ncbi:uncharacterized protein LOC141674178 [Apium graveolens]|uniref:uncharacterized protein LOC141674178 n=1 Tax=Apium graveolens TaxID=4045 RepID=UPI003D7ADF20
MSPELQKQHKHMDAYVIIEHLKRMFEGHARQDRFNTSKDFYTFKQGECDSVGPPVLKMIGYMEYLATLGSAISPEAQIDLILQYLNDNYAQLLMNYNMNEIDKTPTELLAMLKTVETNIQKASHAPIMMALKPRGGAANGDTCHYCKKPGTAGIGKYNIDKGRSRPMSWQWSTCCC